jgi:putative membrane protein insertion efficiency factor
MEKTAKALMLCVIGVACCLRNQMFPRGLCRFHPSCSDYAREAFSVFRPTKAMILVLKRIIKCNPFSSFGFDPLAHNRMNEKAPS